MRLLRPAVALTAVLGLAWTGAVTLAPAATAATTPNAAALASYVSADLVDGNHYEPFGPGSPDVGLTIDGGLALAATGNPTDAATVGKIADYLDSTTGRDYWEPDGDPQYLGVGYAGKLALLAEAAHRDPRSFAGGDLVKVITDNVCTAATVQSDPANCPVAGAFFGSPSVFKQTLPIIAAARAGVVPDTAVQYLLSLQRPDGGWASDVPATAQSMSDPDSTAMAIQALAVLPDPTGAGTYAAAAGKGVDYLAATQRADGSWGPDYNPHSVNSTGLALQTFQISSTVRDAQAARTAKGLAFLAGLQTSDGGLPVSDDPTAPEADVRASVQSLSGVLGVPFGTVVTPVVVQRTATTVPAATAAASYLVGQLVNGDHLERSFEVNGQQQAFVDQSTTGDLAFGLLASGGQDAALGRVLAFLTLDTTLKSYVSGSNFGDAADSVYAGATAKLAFLLQLAGEDPTDVGVNHLDLITQLQDRVGATGWISDSSSFGDNANVLGQAFAVLALTAAGDTTLAPKARTALLAAQCPDGGFPTYFDKPTCTSSPDATGLAVQALNAGRPAATAVAASAELTAAVTWLNGARKADGSYPGDPAVTNSTAYAALGLLAVGQDATATRAYLTSVANTDGGLPVDTRGTTSDAFATAQALPALAGVSFLQIAPAVVRPVSTIAAPNPPITTPPTTTGPTGPGTGSGTGTGGSGVAPTTGASGQGGGTDLAGSGSLPDTGADVVGPLGWALLALLVGTGATVWGSRRPRPAGHAARRH